MTCEKNYSGYFYIIIYRRRAKVEARAPLRKLGHQLGSFFTNPDERCYGLAQDCKVGSEKRSNTIGFAD